MKLMRVKVTFVNGNTINGSLKSHDLSLSLMNDDRQFIPFIQPSGTEVLLNKSNIAFIVRDVED